MPDGGHVVLEAAAVMHYFRYPCPMLKKAFGAEAISLGSEDGVILRKREYFVGRNIFGSSCKGGGFYVSHTSQNLNELAKYLGSLEGKSTLPEYNTVMGIYGVGKTYGPQLIAEIGDVPRFTHREALTAFAGVDPGVDESGQYKSKSNRASKVGSARLRKTLFQIMTTLLQNAPLYPKIHFEYFSIIFQKNLTFY